MPMGKCAVFQALGPRRDFLFSQYWFPRCDMEEVWQRGSGRAGGGLRAAGSYSSVRSQVNKPALYSGSEKLIKVGKQHRNRVA